MITEKRFVQTHQSFWHDLLPMAPRYVRTRNAALERFTTPMASEDASHRGIVNEAGFRLFVRAWTAGLQLDAPSQEEIAKAVASAASFIERFRAHDAEPIGRPAVERWPEVSELARRLNLFFRHERGQIDIWPALPGCGWLDTAAPDAMSGHYLYEVKAGDLPFRGQDLRQVLTYVTLAHSAGLGTPAGVCLVNPRRGVVMRDSLELMCQETAGMGATEVINAVIDYVSEPQWEERF